MNEHEPDTETKVVLALAFIFGTFALIFAIASNLTW